MGLEWVENEGRWEKTVGCWWKEGWVRDCIIAATCGHVYDSLANKSLFYGASRSWRIWQYNLGFGALVRVVGLKSVVVWGGDSIPHGDD